MCRPLRLALAFALLLLPAAPASAGYFRGHVGSYGYSAFSLVTPFVPTVAVPVVAAPVVAPAVVTAPAFTGYVGSTAVAAPAVVVRRRFRVVAPAVRVRVRAPVGVRVGRPAVRVRVF
jgi:hypothetical protein